MMEIIKTEEGKNSDDYQRQSHAACYNKDEGRVNESDGFFNVIKITLDLLGGALITTYLLSVHICVLKEDVARVHLISALLLGSGASSLLLHLVSSNFAVSGTLRVGYLLCSLLALEQSRWKCPGDGDLFSMGLEARKAEWMNRLRELQGAAIFVTVAYVLVSFMGNGLVRFLKPLHIAPSILLAGLAVTKTVALQMVINGSFALFCVTLLVISVLYYITNNKDEMQDEVTKDSADYISHHSLYPAVLGALIMWISCAALSSVGLISVNTAARTDLFTGIFEYADTIIIPHLFQWGAPTFSFKSIILFLPALLYSVLDAAADLHTHKKENSK